MLYFSSTITTLLHMLAMMPPKRSNKLLSVMKQLAIHEKCQSISVASYCCTILRVALCGGLFWVLHLPACPSLHKLGNS